MYWVAVGAAFGDRGLGRRQRLTRPVFQCRQREQLEEIAPREMAHREIGIDGERRLQALAGVEAKAEIGIDGGGEMADRVVVAGGDGNAALVGPHGRHLGRGVSCNGSSAGPQ